MPPKAQELPADIDARLVEETDLAIRTRLIRLMQFHQNFMEGLGKGFPVWGMRIGRCVIIGTPAEPFSDLQVELRKRFPQLAVVVANHTNGSFNYLPPREYFGNGAYEQDCTDYGAGALETVIEAAADLIRTLMGRDLEV
jgi:hypothetical protein